jgi:hypothetical protein
MRELEGCETDALQVEFSFGANFHFPDRLENSTGEFAQELVEGRMPILLCRTEQSGLRWTATVFSRLAQGDEAETGAEVLLTEVVWQVANPSRDELPAQLACHLGAPHMVLGYKVAMRDKGFPYLRSLRWEEPLLLDDRGKARLASRCDAGEVSFHHPLAEEEVRKAELPVADLKLAQDVLLWRANVPAGGSVRLRLVIPFFVVEPEVLKQALRVSSARALARAQAYWKGELAEGGRLQTPEKVVNDSFDAYLYHAMLATGRRPRSGHWILKTSPNNYEALWSAHAAIAAFSMDLRGKHAWSRRVLGSFLANQGPVPASIVRLFGSQPVGESEGFSAHPGFLGNIEGYMAVLWAFYHGWVMWAIGQHARLTGDWRWLKRQSAKLALACEWVTAQRRRTKRRDGRGEKVLAWGLLPASNAFDWGFGHMFWSDAHTYRGLREAAECLARIGHPRAKRFLAEAEAYRLDIIAAVTRSRDASPPVPMEDGSSIPFVPMSAEMQDYFAPDWTYVACGPLNLAWAGVVPADHELIEQTLAFLEAGRPLGAWVEEKKKYQGWDWGAQTPADEDFLEATRPRPPVGGQPGRAYLWRHKMTYEPGWPPQAFVFAERDDMAAFLEHFYSLVSNGGQHVELRSPVEQRDGVPWTQSGDAALLWLMRNMLVRERGGDLLLAGTCPRQWLADGETVGVTSLPTHFGTVTFSLQSEVSRGMVRGRFRFDFRTKPGRVLLRLRHPAGALPREAEADGNALALTGDEWISLPLTTRRLEVRY